MVENEERPPESAARHHVLRIDDRHLHATTWGTGRPELILLHDGLGSVTQWRSFPELLAQSTGLTVLAYDRPGHGRSTPAPNGPWPTEWLHDEAVVLGRVIEEVGVQDPIVVGHSDGGSIAAIRAITSQTRAPTVLLAAHSWVEAITAAEIARMRSNRDQIVNSLARFHESAGALFDAWSLAWTSDEFLRWDIRSDLHQMSCPTLVLQGDSDEFASSEHATVTAESIGNNATATLLPDAGHLLHHQCPKVLVDTVSRFLYQHVDG